MKKVFIANIVLILLAILILINLWLVITDINIGKKASSLQPALEIIVYLILSYGIFLQRRGYFWFLFILLSIIIQFPIYLYIFRDIKFYYDSPKILAFTLPIQLVIIILSLIFLSKKERNE